MFHHRDWSALDGALGLLVLLTIWLPSSSEAQDAAAAAGPQLDPSAITNLHQLSRTLESERRIYRDVNLEVTVCAASRPDVGVVIAADETGFELLQIGDFEPELHPGDRIRIQGWRCLLRKREMGIQLSAGPVVDNDGIHIRRTWPGHLTLNAGLVPIRLDWFNGLREVNLETSWFRQEETPQSIDASNLWHAVVDQSGQTNLLPGLYAECYEGYWEAVPDFDLLVPAKSGIVDNFDAGFRTHDEMVGIRFTGLLRVPRDGRYTIRVRSDDGSLLFLQPAELPVARLGPGEVPVARHTVVNEPMAGGEERSWLSVEGRVGFVSRNGRGLQFELHSGPGVLRVIVADAAGIDPQQLLNSKVRVRGIGRGVLTLDQRVVLGRLFAASGKDVDGVERRSGWSTSELEITSVEQVRRLPVEEARRGLPVRIRGVVTDARNSFYEDQMSLQDDTGGVFVSLESITNEAPAFGEFWEVAGYSGAGDFAPVVMADRVRLLGDGSLPEPVRPSWNELVNGSRDVQWAELRGQVAAVQTNKLALLMPEGRLDVQMDGYYESQLKPFENSVVRIRGVLYAVWNAETREVVVGSVLMRNATVGVEIPAPADPFDAPLKTARNLFLFDPQASAFQRVKVSGQVVHADANRLLVMEGQSGFRVLPAEGDGLHAGDLIEAVGYPEISGPSPVLREAIVRKVGEAALPAAKNLGGGDLARGGLDSTLVSLAGRLLGMHWERDNLVLEMQSHTQIYLARLAVTRDRPGLRVGSRLALTGVFAVRGGTQTPGGRIESFELLLNSPADIVVLSKPPWWTLRRLLTVVGILLVVLVLAAGWITLLRRQVEQRTAQLHREIRQREHAERQHAIEVERSRIARDLHDDLGSSLTEISVLAGTRQRPVVGDANPATLFRAIASKARRLIAALDVIVWAVDPKDDSLQSLADYLSGFAREFFAHSDVTCRFKVPVAFPAVTLSGQVRHDLLLVVKESLNNIVRHAEATEVEFRMAVVDSTLEVKITDNGHGFDPAKADEGHGLSNLSTRLKKLGGEYVVESRAGQGSVVNIRLAMPSAKSKNR